MYMCVQKNKVYGKAQAPQRSKEALIKNTAAMANAPPSATAGFLLTAERAVAITANINPPIVKGSADAPAALNAAAAGPIDDKCKWTP